MGNDNGYIRLSRKFFLNDMWQKKRTFSESEAWLDLIQSARYQQTPAKSRVGKIEVVSKRGQYAASLRFLAEKWGWTLKCVRTFIKNLEKDKMIIVEDSVITLCKYEEYNPRQAVEGTVEGTLKGTVEGTNNPKENKGLNSSEGTVEGTLKGTVEGTNNPKENKGLNSSEGTVEGTLKGTVEGTNTKESINKKLSDESYISPLNPPLEGVRGKRKRTHSVYLNSEAKKIFTGFFKSVTEKDYSWSAKDAGSMTGLLSNVKNSMKAENSSVEDYLPEDAEVLNRLSSFLASITDQWILKHLSVPIVYSKYNEIIASTALANQNNLIRPNGISNNNQPTARDRKLQDAERRLLRIAVDTAEEDRRYREENPDVCPVDPEEYIYPWETS